MLGKKKTRENHIRWLCTLVAKNKEKRTEKKKRTETKKKKKKKGVKQKEKKRKEKKVLFKNCILLVLMC